MENVDDQEVSKNYRDLEDFDCNNCGKTCLTIHCKIFHEEQCLKEWACPKCGYVLQRNITKFKNNIKRGCPQDFKDIVQQHICHQVSFCEFCKYYLLGRSFDLIRHQCPFQGASADRIFPRMAFITVKSHTVSLPRKNGIRQFFEKCHAITLVFENQYSRFSKITFLDDHIVPNEDAQIYEEDYFTYEYFDKSEDKYAWNHNKIQVDVHNLPFGSNCIQKFLAFIYGNEGFKNTSILSWDGVSNALKNINILYVLI